MSYGLHRLIRARRELKGIARTKFAYIVGISPSSMVKYELPENEGGKIPSTVNLSKICELLEIDPRDAFDAINEGIREQEAFKNGKSISDNPEWVDPPEGFRPIPYDSPFSFSNHFKTEADWINDSTQYKSIEDMNDALAHQAHEFYSIDNRLKRIEWLLEGKDPVEETRKETEQMRKRFAQQKTERLNKENGPDQNDPSRSKETSNNPEAVGAASTNHTKGRDR